MKVYDGYFADPFVLRLPEGGYAAYGTGSTVEGRAFEILRSDDLTRWERVGGALEPIEGFTDYWAPEVAFHAGTYWMYYSPGVGDKGHLVRVATCDSPWGPFRDAGVVLTPDERFAIDASPFRDTDGQWYLYFARDVLDGERVGTTVAVDRLVSMTELAGEPQTLLRATDDWQLFLRDREMYGQVHDWHTLEGPFVVRRDEHYVLFYSGGSWERDTYGVSYAIADHPLGPFVEPEQGPVVLSGGRGHNCVVDDRLVYHAWEGERRVMCVADLVWDGVRPRAARA